MRRTLLALCVLLTCHVLQGQAIWTVNTTDDNTDGVCNATHCSLREAIEAANTNTGPDSIIFRIPGAGPHTITLVGTSLPGIFDSFLTIDGTTQPGNLPMAEQIIIDGSLLTGSATHGLVIYTRSTRIFGLVIRNFPADGIQMFGGFVDDDFLSDIVIGAPRRGNVIIGNAAYGIEGPVDQRIRIQSNYLGTDMGFNAGLGNGYDGLFLDVLAGDDIVVGGTGVQKNYICSNNFSGIRVILNDPDVASSFHIVGNCIGTGPNGEVLGNRGFVFGGGMDGGGILISGAGPLVIGGQGDSVNIIANNYIGISHQNFSRKTFHDNIFRCNTNGGVELIGSANGSITTPFNLCIEDPGITGEADPNVRIDVYSHADTGCPDVPCQGDMHLGTTMSDASGMWSLAIAVPPSGSLTAMATDDQGNSSEFSPCLEIYEISVTNGGPYCPGDSIRIEATVSGDPTFVIWTGPNGYISTDLVLTDAVDSGRYTLFISFGGCQPDTATTVVEFYKNTTEYFTVLCAGDQWVVNGNTYDENNLTGMEVLPGATRDGCDSILIFNLQPDRTPTGAIDAPAYACAGDSVEISFVLSNPPGPYDVVYTNGIDPPDTLNGVFNGHTIKQEVTTDLHVRLLDMIHSTIQCEPGVSTSIDTVRVSALQVTPTLSDYSGFNVSCSDASDGFIDLDVSGTVGEPTFMWSNVNLSGSNPTGLEARAYHVTVSDETGCTVVLDTTLSEPAAIIPITDVMRPSCQGSSDASIRIDTVTGGRGNISWSIDGTNFNPVTSFPLTVDDLTAGAFDVFMMDDSMCVTETTIFIPQGDAAFVDLGPTLSLSAGDSITLDFETDIPDPSIQWSPAPFVGCPSCPVTRVGPLQSMVFYVTLSNAAGCLATDSVLVQVFVPKRVYIPNVFSPNGDGRNDRWWIYSNEFATGIEYIVVANRSGTVVYSGNELSMDPVTDGWDGTFAGEPLNPGVYTYLVRIRFSDNSIVPYSGTVTLVR